MKQRQIPDIKTIFIGISILLLPVFGQTVVAVDEEYYIPYTDTYGYVYDPETGTYIQQEGPEQVEPATQPSANTGPAGQNVGAVTTPAISAASTDTDTASPGSTNSNRPAGIVAGILLLLAMAMIMARFFRKTD